MSEVTSHLSVSCKKYLHFDSLHQNYILGVTALYLSSLQNQMYYCLSILCQKLYVYLMALCAKTYHELFIVELHEVKER